MPKLTKQIVSIGGHKPPRLDYDHWRSCVNSITDMAKADLYPDLREFLKSLNSAKVRYLVVGGYAVIYHGYRRATDDLDVWIAVDHKNARLVSRVLKSFAGFDESAVPPSFFLQTHKVFIFGREPVRIDILTGPDGVSFEDCYSRRTEANLDGIIVPLISLSDLKRNKEAVGRAKDLADLENLPPEATPPPPKARSRPKRKRD